MRRSITIKLLEGLNAVRGLTYPMIGYSYWADVTGSGVYNPKVWTICNDQGGVTPSDLNGPDSVTRCKKIRFAIEQAKLPQIKMGV